MFRTFLRRLLKRHELIEFDVEWNDDFVFKINRVTGKNVAVCLIRSYVTRSQKIVKVFELRLGYEVCEVTVETCGTVAPNAIQTKWLMLDRTRIGWWCDNDLFQLLLSYFRDQLSITPSRCR